jgi:molybdate transport system substrate-binding protein
MAVASAAPAAARAADLVIFTGGSMFAPLEAVGEDFTRATGVRLTFAAGTTGVISRKVRAGETVDVIVISADGLKALQADALTAPEPPAPLARAIIGAAVKVGAGKPDISTPEAFKAAMLGAPSVAYPDPKAGATAGIYLAGMLERIGVGPAVASKATLQPDGAQVAAAVASGQAALGLTFISELKPNRQVEVVGPLPDSLQNATLYAAAVSARSQDAADARAFIAFAASATERARLKAAGVDPAP